MSKVLVRVDSNVPLKDKLELNNDNHLHKLQIQVSNIEETLYILDKRIEQIDKKIEQGKKGYEYIGKLLSLLFDIVINLVVKLIISFIRIH